MLHKINLPNCLPAFEWIVQFQTDLLTSLCDNAVGPADVTPEWTFALRPDISVDWIKRFCKWKVLKVPILKRMKDIAALPDAVKQQLLDHFRNNQQYYEAFDIEITPPRTVPQRRTPSLGPPA
ncbi:MAG: hypothetical protein WBB23_18740 [Desulforhopalus sp.]